MFWTAGPRKKSKKEEEEEETERNPANPKRRLSSVAMKGVKQSHCYLLRSGLPTPSQKACTDLKRVFRKIRMAPPPRQKPVKKARRVSWQEEVPIIRVRVRVRVRVRKH